MIEEPMTCQNCYYRDYDPGYPPCEGCLKDKWEIGKLSKWCGAIWEDKNFSNADRIRAMTDEKLAVWIAETSNCSDWCILNEQCKTKQDYECCVNVWLNWLKGEAKDDNDKS